MADRWFRVPSTTGERRTGPVTAPERSGDVRKWAGWQIAESPRWIVRYYASNGVLDDIAATPGITSLPSSDVEGYFEQTTGERRGIDDLEAPGGCYVR